MKIHIAWNINQKEVHIYIKLICLWRPKGENVSFWMKVNIMWIFGKTFIQLQQYFCKNVCHGEAFNMQQSWYHKHGMRSQIKSRECTYDRKWNFKSSFKECFYSLTEKYWKCLLQANVCWVQYQNGVHKTKQTHATMNIPGRACRKIPLCLLTAFATPSADESWDG